MTLIKNITFPQKELLSLGSYLKKKKSVEAKCDGKTLRSQLAERLGARLAGFLVRGVRGVRGVQLRQAQGPPAHLLDGGAGEVVDQRVQCAVEVGQAEAEEEGAGEAVQGGTHVGLAVAVGAGHLAGPHPDQHLQDAGGQEADHEERHHHYDEAQRPPDAGPRPQLAPLPQVNHNVHGEVDDGQQRQDEGQHEVQLVPVEVAAGFAVHREALAVGGAVLLVEVVPEAEDVGGHGPSEKPQPHGPLRRPGRAQLVDGVVGMHHPRVAVSGDGHQEEGAAAPVQGQHEEDEVAHRLPERPAES